MGARRHGQEGALAPSSPCWKCSVLCISSYSKRLNRRIIYALFSLGDLHTPETPNLSTPGKIPVGAYVLKIIFEQNHQLTVSERFDKVTAEMKLCNFRASHVAGDTQSAEQSGTGLLLHGTTISQYTVIHSLNYSLNDCNEWQTYV